MLRPLPHLQGEYDIAQGWVICSRINALFQLLISTLLDEGTIEEQETVGKIETVF